MAVSLRRGKSAQRQHGHRPHAPVGIVGAAGDLRGERRQLRPGQTAEDAERPSPHVGVVVVHPLHECVRVRREIRDRHV